MHRLRRGLDDRVARATAVVYLAVFLTALVYALAVDLTWTEPDAHFAFLLPLALASPTASAFVAAFDFAAAARPGLEVLISTPVMVVVISLSAAVQAVVLAWGVAWLRGRTGGGSTG